MPRRKIPQPSILGWLFAFFSLVSCGIAMALGVYLNGEFFEQLSFQQLKEGLLTKDIKKIERFSAILIDYKDPQSFLSVIRTHINPSASQQETQLIDSDLVKVAVFFIRNRTYGTLELIEDLMTKQVFLETFTRQKKDGKGFVKRYEKSVEYTENMKKLQTTRQQLLAQKRSFDKQHELIIEDLYEYFRVLPDKENPPEPGRLYTVGILKGLPLIAGIPDNIQGVSHLRGVLREVDGRERDYTNKEIEDKIISLQLVFRSILETLEENTQERLQIEEQLLSFQQEADKLHEQLYQEYASVLLDELKPLPSQPAQTLFSHAEQLLKKI
jgi:hypothetical protein